MLCVSLAACNDDDAFPDSVVVGTWHGAPTDDMSLTFDYGNIGTWTFDCSSANSEMVTITWSKRSGYKGTIVLKRWDDEGKHEESLYYKIEEKERMLIYLDKAHEEIVEWVLTKE